MVKRSPRSVGFSFSDSLLSKIPPSVLGWPRLRFLPPLSVGVFTALHFIPTVAYLRAKSSKVQLNPCYPLPPGFGSLPTLFTPRVLSFFFSFLFFQFIVICRGNYLLWAYSSMLETESQFVCLFGRLVYARLIFWNSQMYQSFPLWLLKLSLCLKLPSPPCEYLKRNVFFQVEKKLDLCQTYIFF